MFYLLQACYEENGRTELLERREPVGSKFQPYEVRPRGVRERLRPI
jgi:hypothetical protein